MCNDTEKDPPARKLKEIYEEHGIFTDAYDKEACLKRIKEVDRTIHYDENGNVVQ